MDDTHRSQNSRRDSGETSPSSTLSPREAEKASLKLLRDHVARAVEEIVRLRAQNKSLARRLAEFEASGVASSVFEERLDVSELKSKISSFVSSIDSYLEASEDG